MSSDFKTVKILFENQSRDYCSYKLYPIAFIAEDNKLPPGINLKEKLVVCDQKTMIWGTKKNRWHIIKCDLPLYVDFNCFKFIYRHLKFPVSESTVKSLMKLTGDLPRKIISASSNEQEIISHIKNVLSRRR